MNRQIKFRGKRADNGEWAYGDFIHGVGMHYADSYILPNQQWLPIDCDPLDGYRVDPDSVGQYTGLKDKNGNEIYEGDIMTYGSCIKHLVEFKHGMFGYTLLDGWFVGYGANSNFSFNPLDKSEEHEVIGNIHDNTDLIPNKE